MTRTVMQRIGEIPFVGFILALLTTAGRIAAVVLAIAWALRALEIASVFDRLMPGYSAWELLGMLAAVAVVDLLLANMLHAMESSIIPFTD